MKMFQTWLLLVSTALPLVCCSRISPIEDSEYRKRLEEYYKAIGVQPPDVGRTTEERQVNQPATEPRHDLSPEEMYQQRLKEYYDRVKEHSAVLEPYHVAQQIDEGHTHPGQLTPPAQQHHEPTVHEQHDVYAQRLQHEQHDHQPHEAGSYQPPYPAGQPRYELEQYHRQQMATEPDLRQEVVETVRSPDEEYQKRLQEYYRQFGQQSEAQQPPHSTTERIATQAIQQVGPQADEYQRRLAEYYKQLEASKTGQDTTTTAAPHQPVAGYDDGRVQKPPTLTIDLEGDQRRLEVAGVMSVPSCPRPFLPNGHIKSMNAEKALYAYGEQYLSGTFHFECDGGYEPDPAISSMTVSCHDGKLSPLPRCRRIEACEGIPKPMHGYVDIHHSQIKPSFRTGLFQVGTKFFFVCNHYAVPDAASASMQSECMNGGVWSSYPKCIAMPTCDFFTYLNHVKSSTHHLTVTYRNVTIMRSPLHHGGHNVIPGSILQHACAPGYEKDMASGPLQVQCLSTGHWTDFPRCIMSDSLSHSCSGMPDLNLVYQNHLVAKTYRILQVGNQVTGNITFMCQDNYEPKYPGMSMTVSCQDSRWTPLPECSLKPLCDSNFRIPHGARVVDSRLYFLPGMQDKGYLPGSYIEFMCEPRSAKQITVRRSKISCQQGGSWTQIHGCAG